MRSAQGAIAKAFLRRGFVAEGPKWNYNVYLITAQTWEPKFQRREGIADVTGISY